MLFESLWRIMYVNRYVTHPLYINSFASIEKIELYNYDLNSFVIDFTIIFFQKIALDLPVRSLLLEHLGKSW